MSLAKRTADSYVEVRVYRLSKYRRTLNDDAVSLTASIIARATNRASATSKLAVPGMGGSNPELSLHSLPRPTGVSTTDVTAANTAANTGNMLTPPPPMPATVVRVDSTGSEAYTSPGGGHHHRHRPGDLAAAGLAGAAAGATIACLGMGMHSIKKAQAAQAAQAASAAPEKEAV